MGPQALQLKQEKGSAQDFELYDFKPKELLAKIVEMWKTTLEMSGKDVKLHSKWVEKMLNYTRN